MNCFSNPSSLATWAKVSFKRLIFPPQVHYFYYTCAKAHTGQLGVQPQSICLAHSSRALKDCHPNSPYVYGVPREGMKYSYNF